LSVKIEFFHSPACPHCPQARKVLVEVAEELGEGIEVEELNILSQRGMGKARGYRLDFVPTIVLDGEVKIVGVPSADQLRNAIQTRLNRESLL
jgi:small redox-active disulfide protein 1